MKNEKKLIMERIQDVYQPEYLCEISWVIRNDVKLWSMINISFEKAWLEVEVDTLLELYKFVYNEAEKDPQATHLLDAIHNLLENSHRMAGVILQFSAYKRESLNNLKK